MRESYFSLCFTLKQPSELIMAICSADTKSNYIIDSNDSVISGYLLIFLILKTLLDDQTAAFRHHIRIVPFFFAV